MNKEMEAAKPVREKRKYSTDRDRLKALQIKRIEEPGLYHDGGGLYFQVSPSGTKSWLFRYRLHGRVREMGLGSFLDFSLAEARERARLQRHLVADKIDPIDQRDARNKAAKAIADQAISFEECARDYHKQESVHWKNPKHRDQWINTLRDYAFDKIGNRKVHTISQPEILAVLRPIWKVKPETASRVRQRMRTVLEWAAANSLYPDYPHGIWDLISKSLGQNKKEDGHRVHHAACPYGEVSQLIAKVRASGSQDIVKLAFEFTVLTAARSGETRGALWSEIKWDDRLWVIPNTRMKAKKEHRVPLTARCLEILRQAQVLTKQSPLIFCHPKTKKPFSDAIFTSLLHKGLEVAYTMHGFRSSFRDWGSEKTTHSRELLEVSLAHIPGNSTEHAYWRGDMIERRLALMEDWSGFAAPKVQTLGSGTPSE